MTARETTLHLTDVYRRILTIRLFEQRCIDLGGEAIAGSVHLCGGQEAIPVGARAALEPGDRAIARPVGISTRSPGAIVTVSVTAASRSIPAAPSVA